MELELPALQTLSCSGFAAKLLITCSHLAQCCHVLQFLRSRSGIRCRSMHNESNAVQEQDVVQGKAVEATRRRIEDRVTLQLKTSSNVYVHRSTTDNPHTPALKFIQGVARCHYTSARGQ
eukprot:5244492-Amphidinium_carterae.1